MPRSPSAAQAVAIVSSVRSAATASHSASLSAENPAADLTRFAATCGTCVVCVLVRVFVAYVRFCVCVLRARVCVCVRVLRVCVVVCHLGPDGVARALVLDYEACDDLTHAE